MEEAAWTGLEEEEAAAAVAKRRVAVRSMGVLGCEKKCLLILVDPDKMGGGRRSLLKTLNNGDTANDPAFDNTINLQNRGAGGGCLGLLSTHTG